MGMLVAYLGAQEFSLPSISIHSPRRNSGTSVHVPKLHLHVGQKEKKRRRRRKGRIPTRRRIRKATEMRAAQFSSPARFCTYFSFLHSFSLSQPCLLCLPTACSQLYPEEVRGNQRNQRNGIEFESTAQTYTPPAYSVL